MVSSFHVLPFIFIAALQGSYHSILQRTELRLRLASLSKVTQLANGSTKICTFNSDIWCLKNHFLYEVISKDPSNKAPSFPGTLYQ